VIFVSDKNKCNSRSPPGMTTKKTRFAQNDKNLGWAKSFVEKLKQEQVQQPLQEQVQQQIPSGDDNQEGNSRDKRLQKRIRT
jgi:hypothetical protein